MLFLLLLLIKIAANIEFKKKKHDRINLISIWVVIVLVNTLRIAAIRKHHSSNEYIEYKFQSWLKLYLGWGGGGVSIFILLDLGQSATVQTLKNLLPYSSIQPNDQEEHTLPSLPSINYYNKQVYIIKCINDTNLCYQIMSLIHWSQIIEV